MIGKFALRGLIGLAIAIPVYLIGFTLYACDGNWACGAMTVPDIVDALLNRPVYGNFLTATGGPQDNLPVTLHPAPSLLHLILLALAIALSLEAIIRFGNRKQLSE